MNNEMIRDEEVSNILNILMELTFEEIAQVNEFINDIKCKN